MSLAKVINDHREAVEYDLLTLTGYQLADIGTTLRWGAVKSFLANIPPDSKLVREYMNVTPAEEVWSTREKTNRILADIFDILAQINANLIGIGEGKPAKKPKPYPRPWKDKKQENEKHFGRGALPPDELRKWFERKRTGNAGSRECNTGSNSGTVRSTAEIN